MSRLRADDSVTIMPANLADNLDPGPEHGTALGRLVHVLAILQDGLAAEGRGRTAGGEEANLRLIERALREAVRGFEDLEGGTRARIMSALDHKRPRSDDATVALDVAQAMLVFGVPVLTALADAVQVARGPIAAAARGAGRRGLNHRTTGGARLELARDCVWLLQECRREPTPKAVMAVAAALWRGATGEAMNRHGMARYVATALAEREPNRPKP